MSYWNYRVVQRTNRFGHSYAIHEVFYDSDNHITNWSMDPVHAEGDTVKELRSDLRAYASAIKRPILVETELERTVFGWNTKEVEKK